MDFDRRINLAISFSITGVNIKIDSIEYRQKYARMSWRSFIKVGQRETDCALGRQRERERESL